MGVGVTVGLGVGVGVLVGLGVGVGDGVGVTATKANTFGCNPVPIVGQSRMMMSESFVCWTTDSVAGSK